MLLTAALFHPVAYDAQHVASASEATDSYIVQGTSAEQALALVERVGGEAQRNLPIINGVEALLSQAELHQLRSGKKACGSPRTAAQSKLPPGR